MLVHTEMMISLPLHVSRNLLYVPGGLWGVAWPLGGTLLSTLTLGACPSCMELLTGFQLTSLRF